MLFPMLQFVKFYGDYKLTVVYFVVVFYLFQNGKDNFIGAKVVFPMNDQLCEETVKNVESSCMLFVIPPVCFVRSLLFASSRSLVALSSRSGVDIFL